MKYWRSIVSGIVLLTCAWATAVAQDEEELRRDANAGTVRILASGIDTLFMLHELAATLNQTGSLRVLPIIGDDGVQNVNDTLYLRGIDMALVHYDVLDLIRTQQTYGRIEKRIRYIAKLFSEELHIIARRDIGSIEELAGRRVNYGDPGSGAFERADRIFRALGIAAVPVSHSPTQAIEKVRTGEIDATVHVGPSPSPFVRQLTAADGVHLLAVPNVPGLEDHYKRATLAHDDYPGLIAQGQSLPTIAVDTVLAVFRFENPNERAEKIDNFIEKFFARLGEVQQNSRHPKWREVAVLSDVPGWRRIASARGLVSDIIAKQRVQSEQATAGVSKPLTRQFEAFMAHLRQTQLHGEERRRVENRPDTSDERLNQLFTKFLRWREEQTR